MTEKQFWDLRWSAELYDLIKAAEKKAGRELDYRNENIEPFLTLEQVETYRLLLAPAERGR